MKQRSSFTLIEILVVTTIISLLMAGGIASYSQFSKQSRDARRKADIEQLRAALEIYRSSSATSSYPLTLESLVGTYINSVPIDPKTGTGYTYNYLPFGCDETVTPCSDYLLSTTLEASNSLYQTNPYGGSVITNTPGAGGGPTATTTPSATPTTGGGGPTATNSPTPTLGIGSPSNTPTPSPTAFQEQEPSPTPTASLN